ncbi:MAG: Gfo/Idh/MocA family oxidoreductase [Thermoguttaceae bacterium]|nr:Gfo/Idh/MocA family oxidoreductase [Thermoguttaceae bacterium]
MLKIGIAGFGFMGRMHYRCWNALPDVQVVAVCDSDAQALGDAARNRGNIAGAEGDVDLTGTAVYSSFEQMLREEPLDAVSITVPTFLHAPCTIAALAAGVHVLCEKPMALTLDNGRRMIEAAERSGKLLQIGHCVRFWPEYAKAKEIVGGGQYGRVLAATFQRLAATAARKAGTWFADETLSGGMAMDLHIHDTDFVQYLFGVPRAVSSGGAPAARGAPAHVVTQYRYDADMLVTAEGGWAMMPSFGFEMRFHIAFEQATLSYDLKRTPPLLLCPAEGEAVELRCEGGDGYYREVEHFARRIAGETLPTVITLEDSWNSLRIVLAELESIKIGRDVSLGDRNSKEACHAM